MTSGIIITLCILLLLAYFFDLSASKTRIPSVILLLLLGWLLRQATNFFGIDLPDFSGVLPILGTVGLILIVLEGSLELELSRSKTGLIAKSFLGALFPLLIISFLLAFVFQYFSGYSYKDSLANAIPFSVISSAIAIPTVRHLNKTCREFVIYESSLSDIIGVIFFNFVTLNSSFGFRTFANFGFNFILEIVISFGASIALAILLRKIEHHIKFMPIISLVILIYTVSKVYHLPSLVFILLFGLFLGNLDRFSKFKSMQRLKPELLKIETKKFKELTGEAAFLVRAMFFLLFGYLLKTSEILNPSTIFWAVGIVILIYVVRYLQLKASRMPVRTLLFVAPRGLITILLFLSIDPDMQIPFVNNSLIIQVILLSAIIMMFGMMTKPPRIVVAIEDAIRKDNGEASGEEKKKEDNQSTE
ncbi:MAG: hypothetical protein PHH37_13715 [Paludibacter sp.]|nr:hypothetical protein [Paludibacter sp.]